MCLGSKEFMKLFNILRVEMEMISSSTRHLLSAENSRFYPIHGTSSLLQHEEKEITVQLKNR